jgi:hypothetical protein
MYFDETIFAGLAVIVGTVTFLVGFGYIAYKDIKESSSNTD